MAQILIYDVQYSMPDIKKSISNKTLTLLIGIIVALFLFLSATLFDQNRKEQEAQPNQTQTNTSQTLKIIHRGATNIYSFINKLP